MKNKLIREVLKELDVNGISYCILRNYDFLLEEREGLAHSEKSIDMVVSRKDFSKFSELLFAMGFSKRKPQFSLKHEAFFKIGEERASFDVQVGGVHWNDMCYLDENKILVNKVKKSFFYVPSDEDTFVMLLVHSILGKRYFKPEYQKILTSLVDKVNLDYVENELSHIFNKKITGNLIRKVRNDDFSKINVYNLVLFFIFKCVKNVNTFTKLFLRWIVWKRPLMPSPLVSILGPDGAGKSTLVQNLDEHLLSTGRKTSVIYTGRGRGHILPISKFGRAYKSREKKKDSEKSEKCEKIKVSKIDQNIGKEIISSKNYTDGYKRRLLYTFFAPVFTLDLLLRYWFHIFPQRMKKKVVITDRYCSDILLMKNVPFWFKKILFSLFPKPTMTYFLHNTPEVLHQRRPEEPIEELKRQLSIFPYLVNKFGAIEQKTVDKEKDSEMLVKHVEKELLINWH